MKLLVIDPHTIYRRGLVVYLGSVDGVERVDDLPSVGDASRDSAIHEADVVVLDPVADPAGEFMARLAARGRPPVVACTSESAPDVALNAIRSGAAAFVRKDGLTGENLVVAIRAAAMAVPVVRL